MPDIAADGMLDTQCPHCIDDRYLSRYEFLASPMPLQRSSAHSGGTPSERAHLYQCGLSDEIGTVKLLTTTPLLSTVLHCSSVANCAPCNIPLLTWH